jgi:hypothetical protein
MLEMPDFVCGSAAFPVRKADNQDKRGILSLAGAQKFPAFLFGWKADAAKNSAGPAGP